MWSWDCSSTEIFRHGLWIYHEQMVQEFFSQLIIIIFEGQGVRDGPEGVWRVVWGGITLILSDFG